MYVDRIMSRNPLAVEAERTLTDASRVMLGHGLRHLPVVEHGRLVGVLSERDLFDALGPAQGRALDDEGVELRVRDHMSAPPIVVFPDDEVAEAARLLAERRIGCLPVVETDHSLVGLVTTADLIAAQLRACAAQPRTCFADEVVAGRMGSPPVTVPASATVDQAHALCLEHRIRHLPVVSEGWFVGLASDRDLRLHRGRGHGETRVDAVMSTRLVKVAPEDAILDAAGLMLRRGVDSLPVEREGRLVGVLTSTDVLALLADRLPPA